MLLGVELEHGVQSAAFDTRAKRASRGDAAGHTHPIAPWRRRSPPKGTSSRRPAGAPTPSSLRTR